MSFHPAPHLNLPEPLDGYKLIERLGRGGFGEVWKCEAPGGFMKAVKFVYGDLESSEDGRAAEQELKSLGRMKDIRHPYILTLERYDVIHGQLMVVMELADRNLWDRFRECRMLGKPGIPRNELLSYMAETAEALDLMNDRYKLQHLDIKPQNLFLVYDHVKVADFGLAKMFEGSVAAVTGGVTPVYAAPETFQGEVSRFSDQYSLGIVFQELLTGLRPFQGQNTKQLLLQHLREAPDLSSLPEHDRAIIGRSLEKDPIDRWASCKELVNNLIKAPSQHGRADFGALPLPTEGPKSSVGSVPRTEVTAIGIPAESNPAVFTQPATSVQDTRSTSRSGSLSAFQIPTGTEVSPPLSRSWTGYSTPLPGLVTPKMAGPRTVGPVLQAAAGATLQRATVIETGRMGALGIAPPERSGDGILFPSLVVGLGHTGLIALRRLRHMIRDRFGSCSAVPNVRFLYIDTDPDEIAASVNGIDAIPQHEATLTRLNRPAHYLQREGLPAVEQWLPPNTLYRLPKTSTSAAGVRAYGRLALCDNYRLVGQRIRHQIEPFLNDDTLDAAAKKNGLGVRTNRPRVYVLASLSGGTGGGMFLDLAYLLKHELRNVGYRDPEVHGLFVLPPAEKTTARVATANAAAALVELNHYSRTPYQNRFDTSESPVTDANPPFKRCGLIQWPRKSTVQDDAQVIGAVARAIFLDLFTPVGQRSDTVRAAAPVDKYAGPTIEPFGVFRLTWPRYELLSAITRRFCQKMLNRWTSKENAHLKEPIQHWLADQWTGFQLEPKMIISQFEKSVQDALRGPPEGAFDAAITSLFQSTSGKLEGEVATTTLDHLIRLVGRPDVEQGNQPSLALLIENCAKELQTEAEKNLSTVAVSFIEQPQYRLAGADEALVQITARLNQAIERVEQEKVQTTRVATETFARLFPIIGSLVGGSRLQMVGRRGSLTAELQSLLVAYPRQQYRAILLKSALSLFRKLRDGMPEYVRDVGFCRAKMDGFANAFGSPVSGPVAEPGAHVLPVGCDSLDSAADLFISGLPPEDLISFELEIQNLATRKFRGLANLCLKAERADRFFPMFADAARTFLDDRLEKANPAEALTRYRGHGNECLSVLEDAYLGAVPVIEPVVKPQVESTILAAPDGPDGDHLRNLVGQANVGIEFIPARLTEDVIVYREYPRTPIGDLPQLGDQPRQVYQDAIGSNHHPPHTRTDVEWVVPLKPTR
jgi:eukaryotic-like serine/threonine-protein kinase